MRWNHGNATADDRSRQNLIGVFRNQTEASRALGALHEHAFVAEQDSFAQSSNEPEVQGTSAPTRRAGNWFGELRQIYNEDTSVGSRAVRPDPGSRLAQYDIPQDEAQQLARDFGPDTSVIEVKPMDRWDEAESILKKYGGRIVGSDARAATSTTASDPAPPLTGNATPRLAAVVETAPTVTTAMPSTYNTMSPDPAVSSTPAISPAPAAGLPQATSELSPAVAVNSVPFAAPTPAEPGHIQLFGEELRVFKDKTNNADVRVRKESVTRMETVQVPVTREHLVVEHTDGSPMGREGEIRIPLSEERVRIEKETRLHEEYKAGKRQVTENETVTEPVRKERLLVDQPEDEPKR